MVWAIQQAAIAKRSREGRKTVAVCARPESISICARSSSPAWRSFWKGGDGRFHEVNLLIADERYRDHLATLILPPPSKRGPKR